MRESAGTGKTTTTAHGVDVLGAHGRPVVGLAPSGKAADVLATEALEAPRRFDQAWEVDASLLLRAGDPAAAETHADRGRLRTAHPAVVPLDIARMHRRHVAAGHSVAITTNSAETARAINLAVQRTGTGGPACDSSTARPHELATRSPPAATTPRLRTDQGEKVRNRHTWTVTAAHDDGSLTATHPNRGQVVLPGRYVAERVELG